MTLGKGKVDVLGDAPSRGTAWSYNSRALSGLNAINKEIVTV